MAVPMVTVGMAVPVAVAVAVVGMAVIVCGTASPRSPVRVRVGLACLYLCLEDPPVSPLIP